MKVELLKEKDLSLVITNLEKNFKQKETKESLANREIFGLYDGSHLIGYIVYFNVVDMTNILNVDIFSNNDNNKKYLILESIKLIKEKNIIKVYVETKSEDFYKSLGFKYVRKLKNGIELLLD